MIGIDRKINVLFVTQRSGVKVIFWMTFPSYELQSRQKKIKSKLDNIKKGLKNMAIISKKAI
jgi:hypothetical protein